VRVVPWLVVIVAVGAAVGMIVVLLLTARRQRPVSATVAVPRVCTPVVVVTRTVTARSNNRYNWDLSGTSSVTTGNTVTVAAVTAKVSAAGRGDTLTVTVPGLDSAPSESRAW